MTIDDLPLKVKKSYLELLRDRKQEGRSVLKYLTVDFNGEWRGWENRPQINTSNTFLGWVHGGEPGAFELICQDERDMIDKWYNYIIEWDNTTKEILDEELFKI